MLLLTATAFVALLVGATLHLRDVRGVALGDARRAILTHAQLIASRGAVRIERVHVALRTLMSQRSVREAASNGESCNRLLSQELARNSNIDAIAVATPRGRLLCSAGRSARSVDFLSGAVLREAAAATDFVLGEQEVNHATRMPGIPIADHVIGTGVAGKEELLAALVNPSWLIGRSTLTELPAGSEVTVFDAHGHVILHYPGRARGVSDSKLGAFLASSASSGPVVLAREADFDGHTLDYAITPLLKTGYGRTYLAIAVPPGSVIGPVNRSFYWATGAALTLLAVTFLVVWVVNERLLLKRIGQLSDVAGRLAAGDLKARSGSKASNDELDGLARAFDEMARGLENRQQRLEEANSELLRLNRALKVLSSGNRALVRLDDEKDLVDEICRVVVEEAGYAMAWVGFAEHDKESTVRPVAHRGFVQEHLEKLHLRWEGEEGQSQISTRAIRTGEAVIAQDIFTNPAHAYTREEASSYGFASVAAIPLLTKDGVLGVLNVYAAEPNAFDPREVRVLQETAEDLAYGILNLRGQAERAQLRSSLQNTRDWLRAATQGSLDAFCILRPVRDEGGAVSDLEFVEMNPKAEQQLQVPRNRCVGRTFGELFPTYEAFRQRFIDALHAGKPLEEVFSVRTPKGRTIWVRQQLIPIDHGLAVFWRDITDGMQASQKVAASERKYRELVEALQEGICTVGADGRTTFVNEVAARMLGYKVEDVLGKSASDLLGERGAAALNRALASPQKRLGEPSEVEVRRADGSLFYARVTSTPLRDEAGNGSGILASIVDITERHLGELALARANRALTTLSAVEEELIHATEEEQLLRDVCRTIVEIGGYAKAWVGYAESELGKRVVAKAWVGAEMESLLGKLELSWKEDSPFGESLAGRTIRGARAQVSQDVMNDPDFPVGRELALSAGTRSLVVLPLMVRGGRAHGILSIHSSEPNFFDDAHLALLHQLAGDLSFGIDALRAKAERDRVTYEHLHHAEILRKRLLEGIEAIAGTVEMRDPYTAGHQKRVAHLAVAIAKELGLGADRVDGIYLAGVVHDLGKLAVPAEILSKPGKLTDLEYSLIKEHPKAGYEILKNIQLPWPVADIVHQHHERLDGRGYPQGLKGGAIRLEARILAVADVVEAMASHRPYRASLGLDRALAAIERGRGTEFDPEVVDACLRLFRERGFTFDEDHREAVLS